MSGHLSYFSKLDELKAASDEQLRKEISCLNPEIVTEYVFHLRAELANMKADKEVLIENIKSISASRMIDNMGSHGLPPNISSIAPPPATLLYHPSSSAVQFAQLSGSLSKIRIKKANDPGKGYYLTCHSDTRNQSSTWVLAHRPRPGDKDNYWNLLSWTEEGLNCYKIQKAVKRNKGLMLTAHSNPKSNSDVRVLVHTADHNIPDECWGLLPHYEAVSTYTITKAVNRNKSMNLVAREKRNKESFWVDVSMSEGDVWEIEMDEKDDTGASGSGRGELPFGKEVDSSNISLLGHHQYYLGGDGKGSVTYKEEVDPDIVLRVVQIKPNVIALRSRHGKYLSAQPNGTLEFNRDAANIWEFFTITKISDHKISLCSFHGKFVSAQPNGRMEVNRDTCLAWEHFTITDISDMLPKKSESKFGEVFPIDMPGTVWTWAHNGTTPNGIVEFLKDGGIKWFNGKRQGYWKLRDGGKLLETEFNGVYHELEYCATEKRAVLRCPVRHPPSVMWIQGDRGELPFGKDMDSNNISLLGHHQYYLGGDDTGSVTYKEEVDSDLVLKVVQIKPNVIALRSRHEKYLSAQPNGTLEFNRVAANIWEFFTISKISDHMISLKSFHGKFVSAQPDGRMEVNRDKCLAWEQFTVTNRSDFI